MANASPQTSDGLPVCPSQVVAPTKQSPFQAYQPQHPTVREQRLQWQKEWQADRHEYTRSKYYGQPHYLGLPPKLRHLIQDHVLFQGHRYDAIFITKARLPPEFQLALTCKRMYSEIKFYPEACRDFWSNVRIIVRPWPRHAKAIDRIADADLQFVKNIELVMSIDYTQACLGEDLSCLRPARPRAVVKLIRVDGGIWRNSALHKNGSVKKYPELRAIAGKRLVMWSWQRYSSSRMDKQTEVYGEPSRFP